MYFARNNAISDKIQLNNAILFKNCKNTGILCYKYFCGFLKKVEVNTDFLHDTRHTTDSLSTEISFRATYPSELRI